MLQLFTPFIKKTPVPTELINDDTFDEFSVLRFLQHDRTIDGGKDATTVDIGHQDDIGSCIAGHRNIHDIHVAEVDFGNAACTFHHDGVIAGSETVESFVDSLSQHFASLAAEILRGMLVTDGTSVENHL